MFRRCKSCKDGRVFYLKFTNNRREFFWMQDADDSKDASNCRRINEIINGEPGPDDEPAAAASSSSAPKTPAASGSSSSNNADLEAAAADAGISSELAATMAELPEEERQQLMAMLGLDAAALGDLGGAPETPAAAQAATPSVAPNAPGRVASSSASGGGAGAVSFDDDMFRSVMSGLAAHGWEGGGGG